MSSSPRLVKEYLLHRTEELHRQARCPGNGQQSGPAAVYMRMKNKARDGARKGGSHADTG